MRKVFQVATLLIIIYSCSDSKSGNSSAKFNYKSSALGTLKEIYDYNLSSNQNYDAIAYFVRKHKDEVLRTLEIVEEVEVQKDVILLFYRYSIGTDIVKKTLYMRKMDGLYIP